MSGSNDNKPKRVRAPNFSIEETRLLLKIALKEKHILENKQTDSETWKLKNDTWKTIADTFNSASGQTFRTVDTLRSKYDGMKKGLKKKVNKNTAETMKTGGGKPDYIPIEGPEKELLEVLSIQIHGLPTVWDSDNMLTETTITGEASKKDDIIGDFSDSVETETTAYCAEPFITEKTEDISEVLVENTDNEFFSPKPTEAEETTSVVQAKDALEENPEKKQTSASQTWKSWSPGLLRSKKHPVLTPKRAVRENKNKKMDDVLGLREELISKQILQIENQERRAQAKHDKEMERAQAKHDREMELLNLDILIKRKQLENKNLISFL